MRVRDVMTPDVNIASPDQSICDVARIMAECDVGSLPVGQNGTLVGMITDRDIATRAVGQHKSPDTRVREVMSTGIKYCFADQDVVEVAHNMGDLKVRRLPVVDDEKCLIGIVSIADVATKHGPAAAGDAVCRISQPGADWWRAVARCLFAEPERARR
jgi:CBS domain-containing protein